MLLKKKMLAVIYSCIYYIGSELRSKKTKKSSSKSKSKLKTKNTPEINNKNKLQQ